MELVDGLEPPTCWLQISCSTNWATPAYPALVTNDILPHKTRLVNTKNQVLLFFNTLSKKAESRRQDLNLRHLGPKPSTLPNWVTPRFDTRKSSFSASIAPERTIGQLIYYTTDLPVCQPLFCFLAVSTKKICALFALWALLPHFHAVFRAFCIYALLGWGKCLQNGWKLTFLGAVFVHMYNIMYLFYKIPWFLT